MNDSGKLLCESLSIITIKKEKKIQNTKYNLS